MKIYLIGLLMGWILINVTSANSADASSKLIPTRNECAKCLRLNEIAKLHAVESRKESPDYTKLGSEASKIINDFGTKDKLSNDQIDGLIEVMRANVPVDPSRALIEDTMPVILENRAAIETKIKALTKRESETLLAAIEAFALARKRGQDN